MKTPTPIDDIARAGTSYGPVSADVITQAETALAVRFPEDYKDFLRKFGALVADGFEIFGLPHVPDDEPPMWQSVLDATDELRGLQQLGTENPDRVVISEDGMGNYYFLDTTAQGGVWLIGADVERKVSDSFSDFVLQSAAQD